MPKLLVILLEGILVLVLVRMEALAEFRAGAVAIDITPLSFPVFINGGMTSISASAVTTPIHARAVVMEDDGERVALVVVDSCMLQRSFLDEVKAMASRRTGIRTDHMLISATHAHSAPAAMGCLGTDADHAHQSLGDALGMVGQGEDAGKLIFQSANRPWLIGRTAIPRWTWTQVQLARDGDLVQVYLNQNANPEIQTKAKFDLPLGQEDLFFGGRGSRESSWEGRIDEDMVHVKP